MKYLLIGGKFEGDYTNLEGTRVQMFVPSESDWDHLSMSNKTSRDKVANEVEYYREEFINTKDSQEKVYVHESFSGDVINTYKRIKVFEAITDIVNSKDMMNFIDLLRYENQKQWDDSWVGDIKLWIGNTVRYNYLW